MSNLSTQPYKGTRDFYPEDMFVQNFIFRTMRDTVESYGYTEYSASILEETALYMAKTGDEIVNEQTYSFTDRGGREVTMRPEMTPTVARMVAQKRKELQFPLRWYSIPNLFRYERPQRGRLREHWQLNVDIFGVDSLDAEVEIIAVAHDIMTNFGATENDFVIKINNRKLINFVLKEHFKLDDDATHATTKLIDRMLKMQEDEFIDKLGEVAGATVAEELMKLLQADKLESLPPEIQETEYYQELVNLQKALANLGMNNIQYDSTLVRGFDYYTGVIFEVFDNHPDNNRSLFGGGRYDDLVGIFGVDSVSAVGFGMGDVTMRDFLESYGMLPHFASHVQVIVAVLDNAAVDHARALAQNMRRNGISTALDTTYRKAGAIIKTAEKHNVPYLVFVGEDEMNTKKYKLKRLAEHNDYEVTEEEMISHVKES